MATRSLKMYGPYIFSAKRIKELNIESVPGCFALGYLPEADSADFVVIYIGYAAADLRQVLLDCIGTNADYLYFKYRPEPSGQDAFTMCCRHFHEFGGIKQLRNTSHPERPAGARWECPLCEIFDTAG